MSMNSTLKLCRTNFLPLRHRNTRTELLSFFSTDVSFTKLYLLLAAILCTAESDLCGYTSSEKRASVAILAVCNLRMVLRLYSIPKIKINFDSMPLGKSRIREGLELNGLHQLLVYADDMNMLRDNPQTIRENTGILLEASKEVRNLNYTCIRRRDRETIRVAQYDVFTENDYIKVNDIRGSEKINTFASAHISQFRWFNQLIVKMLDCLSEWILAAGILTLIAYLIGTWTHSYFYKINVFHLKPVPFFGNMAPVVLGRLSFPDFINDLYKRLEGHKYGGVYEFLNPVIMIRDPELLKTVTVKDFEFFLNHRNPMSEEVEPLFGKGLFSLQDFSCAAQQLNASQSTHRFSFVNHTIKTVNMPKVRHSVNLKSKLTSYISEFKEDGLSTDNKILFCNLCQCAVSSTQKFLVQQYITTSKHQANKQLNSKQRQLFLTQPTTSNVRSEFNIDLCRSLISADIPLYKLKNKVFREFLEKYTQHTIPDESTLRKTYAPSIYDETIQKIRDEIKDSSIWVSIDETPDKEGQKWKDMRSTLSPAFTSSKMKTMFTLITECGEQLGDFLKTCIKDKNMSVEGCKIEREGDMLVVEMKDLFTRYTNDVIATSAFGIGCDSLNKPKNEFYEMGRDITNFGGVRSLIFFGYLMSPRLMKLLKIRFMSNYAMNFFRSLVHGTMATREAKDIYRPDMIQLLMQAKKETLQLNGNATKRSHDKTSEVGVQKSFPFFKYAPITSCDVERTFFQYKKCLSDHRRRFTLQSLKMYVTLHCNAHTLFKDDKFSRYKNCLSDRRRRFSFDNLREYIVVYCNAEWDDDDLTAQAVFFFFAGFDTASTLLCFASHLLATHPDVQSRLQKEIDEKLENDGGKLTYEAVHSMKYLDMVVSEVLRLYPPAVFSDRKCIKTYTIQSDASCTIQPGQGLWIPVYAFHHDPKYFPNPEKFDPERFSDENKDNLKPYTYLPFGLGPRSCIGNRFALMEAKIALVHLLTRFNLKVVSKTPIPIQITKKGFNMTVDGGFWLGLEQRAT
ncbi:hypothetical protein ANN_25794 [Periplaneta americana]|uniref:Cytochrome P450 9e2 n=1 Tax=Periplaneta americana TaxID=6978 RepID=A0ABQ8S459_PERAM|nr:hypothetical protein ANN_25794 [Periplaneta americana]